MQEIKTLEERKNDLLVLGKKQGHITYEQLAESLKGLEVEPDDLDELYNFFMTNNIRSKNFFRINYIFTFLSSYNIDP